MIASSTYWAREIWGVRNDQNKVEALVATIIRSVRIDEAKTCTNLAGRIASKSPLSMPEVAVVDALLDRVRSLKGSAQ